jgi:hypothetical protein
MVEYLRMAIPAGAKPPSARYIFPPVPVVLEKLKPAP